MLFAVSRYTLYWVILLRYGHIKINIEEKLNEKGLSKNKFSQKAEMQRTQLNKYINNEIVLLNIDVLARMCAVLECDISDILEYVPENKNK